MRRWLVFPLICTSVFSQNSTLANNSNTEDNAGFVVRINVNLVQVDAEVTDMHGKPATDLKADDFKVLQDGVPQTITNFSYVAGGAKSAITATVTNQRDGDSPILAPTPLKREQVRRVFALVVDDLGLSFTSVAYVHAALKKFVDHEIRPGDLVAIIRNQWRSGSVATVHDG